MNGAGWAPRLRRIALQRDLRDFATVVEEELVQVFGAQTVALLAYDPVERGFAGTSESSSAIDLRATGLASDLAEYARTPELHEGRMTRREGRPRLLVPMHASTGELLAVLAVLGAVNGEAPSPPWVCRHVGQVAPLLDALWLEQRERAAQKPGLFRAEALEAHRGPDADGPLLKAPPRWSESVFWCLGIASLVFVAALGLLEVGVYSSAASVVEVDDAGDIVTVVPGSVATVYVQPGDQVQAGDLLAELETGQERLALDQARRAYDQSVMRRLQDPTHPTYADEVAQRRSALETELAQVERKRVRAVRGGVVGDVHVRPGQVVEAGRVLLTVRDPAAPKRIRGFFPAADRPSLEPGQPLLLDVQGLEHRSVRLRIDTVSEEAIGPSEVGRWLGPQRFDTLDVHGPLVQVTAQIPDTIEMSDGSLRTLHEGMAGTLEVRVQRRRLIFVLLPGLEDWLFDENWD